MLRETCLSLLISAAAGPACAQPELSLPPDRSSVSTAKPALAWSELPDAHVYVVSIFSDSLGKKRVAKFTIRGNSCLVGEGLLEKGVRYWWNVAPIRSGILGEPSAMWSFTVSSGTRPEKRPAEGAAKDAGKRPAEPPVPGADPEALPEPDAPAAARPAQRNSRPR